MIATLYHGESDSLWYLIDNDAPADEQPAVVGSISCQSPNARAMTLEQITHELKMINLFRWTPTCYNDPATLEEINRRHEKLHRRQAQLEHGITPLVAEAERRDRWEYEKFSRAEIAKRYPNIVAHIICESLGYSTPGHAASVLQHAVLGDPEYCEWISACYRCDPTIPVRDAIRRRHHHTGYMSEIKLARQIVREFVEKEREPIFASWM